MSVLAHALPCRVLVADDHPPTRDDIRRTLEADGGFRVCAEASNAAEAVQQALATRPDICMLDIRMPGGGVAAAWEIAARVPKAKIVMITVSDADEDLFAALRAGASGYLVKDASLLRLPETLRDVEAGKAAMPRALVARLVERFHGTGPRFRTTDVVGATGERLTSREWEILELLAEGLSTRAIAHRLTLGSSGVRAHITSIVRKLGVADRHEAIALFRQRSES